MPSTLPYSSGLLIITIFLIKFGWWRHCGSSNQSTQADRVTTISIRLHNNGLWNCVIPTCPLVFWLTLFIKHSTLRNDLSQYNAVRVLPSYSSLVVVYIITYVPYVNNPAKQLVVLYYLLVTLLRFAVVELTSIQPNFIFVNSSISYSI